MPRDPLIVEDHVAIIGGCFGCDTPTARSIADQARHFRYAPRDTIVTLGDTAQDAWIMLVGESHAVLFSAAGQLVLIHRFGPGDLFGAATGVPAITEGTQVVAVQPTDVGRFRALDFIMLVERHGCVAATVMNALTRRLSETTRRMIEASTLSATGRVHAELLRQARAADGRTIRPAPVLAEMALTVQSTRETVSRAINALERAGIIQRSPEALVIIAPHRLEELVY
jgi:CRP/FNR family transcriptional regulator, cyclic AMP receptor protein